MGALRPYLLLVLAVAIGVALAPYVGGLLLFLAACGGAWFLFRFARSFLVLAGLLGGVMLFLSGIDAVIRDPHSPAAQWTIIALVVIVVALVWRPITRGVHRWAAYMEREG